MESIEASIRADIPSIVAFRPLFPISSVACSRLLRTPTEFLDQLDMERTQAGLMVLEMLEVKEVSWELVG